MRTTVVEQIGQMEGWLKNHPWIVEMANKVGCKALESLRRGYIISAEIGFWLESTDIKLSQDMMKMAIIDADRAAPWRDKPLPYQPHESIAYLSDGEEIVHNFKIPEKVWWFYLWPSRQDVGRGQVYAYEVYLAKLAESISHMRIPGVTKVNSVLCTRSAQYFECHK